MTEPLKVGDRVQTSKTFHDEWRFLRIPMRGVVTDILSTEVCKVLWEGNRYPYLCRTENIKVIPHETPPEDR